MARVLISMPEKFLDEIDSVASTENRTRSELIREALRTYMYRNQLRNSQKSISNAELLDSLLG
ncbi:ribbon-helix-helix protein, CopG family [bacterium]|nr:ribbon-helix-helix protein, CopG family [bacterium]